MLESGTFILGPNVKAFEEEAAAYLGVPETIGVANGTDALVLVLDALGIGPGDEVICPAFTFYATAESIARRGRDARVRRDRPADAEPRPAGRRRADHAADEGDHARAPLRPPGPARGARLARPAADRGRGAGLRLAGHRHDRRRLDVQLLPDEEPVRARRRRPRRLHRRRARRPDPDAPLPRLAREGRLRVRRLQLAPRRGPGGGAADLPPGARRLERARGGRRPSGTASWPRRPRARRPSTSPATCTTSSSAARPSATASSRRCARPGSARTSVLPAAAPPAAGARATSAGRRATCPRPSALRRRTSRVPLWAGITPEQQERVVDVVREAVGARVEP